MKNDSPLTHLSKAFVYAWAGLCVMYRTQMSFRIQLAVAGIMIATGLALGLSAAGWCWLAMAIGTVMSAEALNTAIEFLSNIVCPEYHPEIKKVKDVAATAVLLASTAAILVGLLVLGPPLWARLTGG
jgi:diacylglycerol kinase